MFNFRDTNQMLPSELVAYIGELETEVLALNKANKKLSVPDAYVRDDIPEDFVSEQELIDSLKVGDVVEVNSYKKFGHSFKVKISKSRIDDCATRIEAEAKAMLHSI